MAIFYYLCYVWCCCAIICIILRSVAGRVFVRDMHVLGVWLNFKVRIQMKIMRNRIGHRRMDDESRNEFMSYINHRMTYDEVLCYYQSYIAIIIFNQFKNIICHYYEYIIIMLLYFHIIYKFFIWHTKISSIELINNVNLNKSRENAR